MSGFDRLLDCLNFFYEHKALDVVVFHNKAMADKIILCSCESSRHVKALATGFVKQLKSSSISHAFEGMEQGHWVLIDTQDMIIHIFRSDVREYYNIDDFLNNGKF